MLGLISGAAWRLAGCCANDAAARALQALASPGFRGSLAGRPHCRALLRFGVVSHFQARREMGFDADTLAGEAIDWLFCAGPGSPRSSAHRSDAASAALKPASLRRPAFYAEMRCVAEHAAHRRARSFPTHTFTVISLRRLLSPAHAARSMLCHLIGLRHARRAAATQNDAAGPPP